jgi:hypothetical protein
MPQHRFDNGVFDPATIQMMGEVFDAVWTQVEPDFRHLNAHKRDSVRVELASAVRAYGRLGIRDPLVLRAMALGIMRHPTCLLPDIAARR